MHLARILRNNTVLKDTPHAYMVQGHIFRLIWMSPSIQYKILLERCRFTMPLILIVAIQSRTYLRHKAWVSVFYWRLTRASLHLSKSIGGADGTRTHIKRFCRPLRNQFRTRHHATTDLQCQTAVLVSSNLSLLELSLQGYVCFILERIILIPSHIKR